MIGILLYFLHVNKFITIQFFFINNLTKLGDGTLMQGFAKEPYVYKNNKMWFRGTENTKA